MFIKILEENSPMKSIQANPRDGKERVPKEMSPRTVSPTFAPVDNKMGYLDDESLNWSHGAFPDDVESKQVPGRFDAYSKPILGSIGMSYSVVLLEPLPISHGQERNGVNSLPAGPLKDL